MARLASKVLQSIVARVPSGFALGNRGGVFEAMLGMAAEEIVKVELRAEQLMDETDPRSARELLPDFERVLGPDPCGRDKAALSIEERQRLAHQRWTATGGQSRAYMIQVAANLGVAITIDEFWPSKTGNLRCGHRLRPHGIQYYWRVNVPGLVTVTKFRTGTSVTRHRLGSFALSNIECELRRTAPAHTHIVFSYSGA